MDSPWAYRKIPRTRQKSSSDPPDQIILELTHQDHLNSIEPIVARVALPP